MSAPITSAKSVWIVVHERPEDMGSLQTFFRAHGVEPQVLIAHDVRTNFGDSATTDFRTLNAATPDLLIVMGGPMNVYEATDKPWMAREISFIKDRIAADKPLLGVCLGSQMIASALGAPVMAGADMTPPKPKEIGYLPITVNDAGMNTPIRHFDETRTRVAQWHSYTMELPQGATLLASSPLYEVQAYSVGPHIMATQFHIELNDRVKRRWGEDSGNELPQVSSSRAHFNMQYAEHGAGLQAATFAFLKEWLDHVSPGLLAKPQGNGQRYVPA